MPQPPSGRRPLVATDRSPSSQAARRFSQRRLITPSQADGAVALVAVKVQNIASGHVFISYAREDSSRVDRLQLVLRAAGIQVWRDTDDLWPGQDWKAKIGEAIQDGSLAFIACYSHQALARSISYMRAELDLAFDQMQFRSSDDPWFIPVRLDDCEIPDRSIGGGRMLASIQRVDLFGDRREEELARLVATVLGILGLRSGPRSGKPAGVTPSDVLKWEDNVTDIMKLIPESQEVWLWGAALTEHIPMLRETLRIGARKGVRVRVLLIAPDSAAVRMLAFRAAEPPPSPAEDAAAADYIERLNETASYLNRKLAENIADLERIMKLVPGEHLQYRTLDYLAPYVIYAFDPESPRGRLIVRVGFHAGNNQERPTLWFSKEEDPSWFNHFMHQIEIAWSAASAMEEAGGWSAGWNQM
jgi:hypothetical protein